VKYRPAGVQTSSLGLSMTEQPWPQSVWGSTRTSLPSGFATQMAWRPVQAISFPFGDQAT